MMMLEVNIIPMLYLKINQGQQVRKFIDIYWAFIVDQALTVLHAKDSLVNIKDKEQTF